MALNASGPISLAGSTTGQSIAVELGLGTTTQISLNQAAVRTLAGIASGAIIMPTNFWGKSNAHSYKAIFGFGYTGAAFANITNLVSNTGVVAADQAALTGTARSGLAGAIYGTDKAIFGFGYTGARTAVTNKVSNTGVVAIDTAGVGTVRYAVAGAGYGTDKAIFAYGNKSNTVSISRSSQTNLVSNTGVVAADQAALTGGPRQYVAGAGYGTDKAIIGYGNGTILNTNTNLVSNTGVVAADVANSATYKIYSAAAGYGTDKAIIGFGNDTGAGIALSKTNLISNTGVVAADQVAAAGTARTQLGGAGYGVDTAIFGFGVTYAGTYLNITNLISNTGVVAADQVALTGTIRTVAGSSYG